MTAPNSESATAAPPSKETNDDDENDTTHQEEKKSEEADKDEREVNWHDASSEKVAEEDASEPPPSDEEETESDQPEASGPKLGSVPIVSLSSGLKHKASPLELHSWIALALTLDGRDKVTKVFQYSARTLAWWFVGTNQAQRFSALKVSLTTSRKAYRLGRSLIELHRLRSMGLLETIGWHLHRHAEGEEEPPPPPVTNPKTLFRRASSNIGWGPVTLEESQAPKRKLLRSLSSVAYAMYRPMASTLSISGEAVREPSTPLWKLVGSAIKMSGLLGFWMGDNVAFLTQSGLFDDYRLDATSRMAERKALQTRASRMANQCYFVGAVGGLVVNLRSYVNYRNHTIRPLVEEIAQAAEDDDDDEASVLEASLARAKEKQFALFLALVKSCCDVLVFSNNPGIDLWKRRTGRKMHEGFHCLCGLLSASTVLYNNFPNATNA